MPTPTPTPDERFGVITAATGAGSDLLSYRLNELGIKWHIDYGADPSTAPPGTVKVPYYRVEVGNRPSVETIAQNAMAVPGSVWYIGGEPNPRGISPADFVVEFDYYVNAIKSADPTARITSASILNWDFTCVGCFGFKSGESWMREFIDIYQETHDGALPPVDIWAIDVYPLTWDQDQVPMTNWPTVVKQIEGFRNYLDTELLRPSDPIWVTEIASHWAYDAWILDSKGLPTLPSKEAGTDCDVVQCLDWDADYRWDAMEDYMTSILDWLRLNGPGMRIEKWFFFIDYVDVRVQSAIDGYAGIYLFENDQIGAPLNLLGQLYRDYATGQR